MMGHWKTGLDEVSFPALCFNLHLRTPRWILGITDHFLCFFSQCEPIKQICFLCFLSLLVIHWCLEERGGQAQLIKVSRASDPSNSSGNCVTELTLPKSQDGHSEQLSSGNTVAAQREERGKPQSPCLVGGQRERGVIGSEFGEIFQLSVPVCFDVMADAGSLGGGGIQSRDWYSQFKRWGGVCFLEALLLSGKGHCHLK